MPRLKNKTHEEFAQLIAAGKTQKKAYLLTHPDYQGQNAKILGFQIRQIDAVNARVAELLEKTGQQLNITKESLLKRLVDMLDTAPDDAELDDPNCDLKYVTKDGTPVAVPPDRLRTIELIAKITGISKDTLEVTANEQILEMLKGFKE